MLSVKQVVCPGALKWQILHIQWGFDSYFTAYKAYEHNFHCAALHLSAKEFIALRDTNLKVDILHLSPC